jgi:AraC-like DNA-binding protein
MNGQQHNSSNNSEAVLRLSNGYRKIRDYDLSYSILDIRANDFFCTVFPRTGFLIFSFITGTSFRSEFVNYDRSVTVPNHMYIAGLFSKSSLLVSQIGQGGGFAMKVHPVVGYHFLRMPLYELTDRQIRICFLLQKYGQFLEKVEANHEISSMDHPLVRKFFIDALPPKSAYLSDPVFHAVNDIISSNGRIEVQKLARSYYMSERTLNRQFLVKVGLSAQAYAKIWQIQYALELIQANPTMRITQVAYEAGYYDVAHMVRDFNNKVSFAPSAFHKDINPLSGQYLSARSSFQ